MYGRVNIIFGEKDEVENGVAHLEASDRAAVEATAGNQGLTTLVDREAGMIVAVSYWDALTHSSEAALARAREGAAAAAGGDLIVESYEVVMQERMTAPVAGFCTAELMIDRGTGNGLLMTTWMREDRQPAVTLF